jgi:hypothetical protein
METDLVPALNPDTTTILSDEGGRRVEILHRANDPGMWIIRSSHTRLGITKKSSTKWFQSKGQALAFADKETELHHLMSNEKRNIIRQ